MTDAPRISDEELTVFCESTSVHSAKGERLIFCGLKQALAAFLSARVPDAVAPAVVLFLNEDDMMPGHEQPVWKRGFNACREHVLKGRE
tara:strand:- start:1476 stop:1742 length:267 start_codon:yes stop_codon:yes gene_type:complete